MAKPKHHTVFVRGPLSAMHEAVDQAILFFWKRFKGRTIKKIIVNAVDVELEFPMCFDKDKNTNYKIVIAYTGREVQ